MGVVLAKIIIVVSEVALEGSPIIATKKVNKQV